MADFRIHIDDFTGGISSDEEKGFPGAFIFAQNCNIHNRKGLLQSNPKTTAMTEAESPNNINGPVYWIKAASNSKVYATGGVTEGIRIYEMDPYVATPTWTLVHTDANAGTYGGLIEYKDYLYWAGNATAGRYGPLSGTPAWTDSWQTLNACDWHPMFIGDDDKLYIGNGSNLASWDGTTFTSAALDLPTGTEIKCLSKLRYNIAIGTRQDYTNIKPKKAKIFFWDYNSESWNDSLPIDEYEILAMIYHNGILKFSAGDFGDLYYYNGTNLEKKFSFARDENDLPIGIYPGGMIIYRGKLHIGVGRKFESSTGNIPSGVYSFGRKNSNFPEVPNLEYTVASGNINTGNVTIFSLESTGGRKQPPALLEKPETLYLGVIDQNGSGFAIETTDVKASVYVSNIVYESLIQDAGRPEKRKLWKKINIVGRDFSSSNTVTVKYKDDYASFWTTVGTINTDIKHKGFDIRVEARKLQIRLELAGAAKIKNIILEGDYLSI
ncbi:MAG: hypothetical protein AB1414_01285 [bacterium]